MPSGDKDPPKKTMTADIDRSVGKPQPLEKPATPAPQDPLSVKGKPAR